MRTRRIGPRVQGERPIRLGKRGMREGDSDTVSRWPPPFLAYLLEEGVLHEWPFEVTRAGAYAVHRAGGWDAMFKSAAAKCATLPFTHTINERPEP
jgi:hypothetical protein